jgi:hypothetical protein
MVDRENTMILKHKNTYRAKDEIKNLGGVWKSEEKGWLMPNQSAYDEALKFCEALDKDDVYDDVDGFEQNVKIGLAEDQQTSVDWMFPRLGQKALDDQPIPLKENTNKKVISGLKFKGRLPNVRDTWIVTAYKEDWTITNEHNSFCCINLTTGIANFLTEEQIKQHVWLDASDIEQAKIAFKGFVNA